jgi:hypothetical protein
MGVDPDPGEPNLARAENPAPADAAPPSLGYESPREHLRRNPPVNVLAITFVFGLGFGVGLLLSLLSGCCVMAIVDGHKFRFGFGIVYGLGFYAIALALIWFQIVGWFRAPMARRLSHWFGLGTLFGLGISLLLQGVFLLANISSS